MKLCMFVTRLAPCFLIIALTVLKAENAPSLSELIIEKAAYGDLPDGKQVDVTQKVTAMVKDNALHVDASNLNFGDPAENVKKTLRVDYRKGANSSLKIVDENTPLVISADEIIAPADMAWAKLELLLKSSFPPRNGMSKEEYQVMLKDRAISIVTIGDAFMESYPSDPRKWTYILSRVSGSKLLHANNLKSGSDAAIESKTVMSFINNSLIVTFSNGVTLTT